MLTALQQQPPPPTNRRGSEEAAASKAWLEAAYKNKWAEVILKKPGEEWVSAQRSWSQENIAKAILRKDQIIGLRPEGEVRVIFTDFDRKSHAVSPYWEARGQSPELLRLQQEAERCGCHITMLVSSDSGGLHGVVSLPAGVKAWLAHWVGVVLLERSGMREESGKAEVFPSEIQYSKGERESWARSHGVRLPGQQGCKLIAGNAFAEDTNLIYEQLLCDLEETETCENWEELLEAAKKRARQSKIESRASESKFIKKKSKTVEWTAEGQSEQNLARIAYAVRKLNAKLTCEKTIAALIKDAALNSKGFDQFASDETKKDLMRENGWALRWARHVLRRNFNSGSIDVAISGDKYHNERLYKQSRAKLTRVWKQFKEAASWSKRRLAEAAGLSRSTLEKHWEYWVQLVAYTPSITGGPVGSGGSGGGSSCAEPSRAIDKNEIQSNLNTNTLKSEAMSTQQSIEKARLSKQAFIESLEKTVRESKRLLAEFETSSRLHKFVDTNYAYQLTHRISLSRYEIENAALQYFELNFDLDDFLDAASMS